LRKPCARRSRCEQSAQLSPIFTGFEVARSLLLSSSMTFFNRLDAGRQLGGALLADRAGDPIVVGISRGGVPVAAEVAEVLRAPLEICVVRKLFSPGSPSFSIGAVAENGAIYLDEPEIAKLKLSATDVKRAIELERLEVERLGELLRDRSPLALKARDVIVVDDGVSMLDTLYAAVRSVRTQNPASVTLAVPVGDAELLDRLRTDVDRIVCLVPEHLLVSVGSRYRDFWPVSENEVAALLGGARRNSTLAGRRAS
jgi:putative phosphoribosyl transferase